MRAALIIAALTLSACTNTVRIVEVPVPVTCQTPEPAAPDYQVVQPADGLFVRTQKLLVNDRLKDAYIVQLKAWGKGCNVDAVALKNRVDTNDRRFAVAAANTSAVIYSIH